jgi:fatty acid desaturase
MKQWRSSDTQPHLGTQRKNKLELWYPVIGKIYNWFWRHCSPFIFNFLIILSNFFHIQIYLFHYSFCQFFIFIFLIMISHRVGCVVCWRHIQSIRKTQQTRRKKKNKNPNLNSKTIFFLMNRKTIQLSLLNVRRILHSII